MSRAANTWLWGWTVTSFLMCVFVCLVIGVCFSYVVDFILSFINIQVIKPSVWIFVGFHMFVGFCWLLLIVISNRCSRKGRCFRTCCCCHVMSTVFVHFLHLLWIILIIVMLFPALIFIGVHFACVYVPTCISVTDFGLQADLFEQYNIEGVLAAINNFNTSSLYGIAEKLEQVFVNYLDKLEDSEWLESLLTTIENSEVARTNTSTLFRRIDQSTEFVLDQFSAVEGKVDLFATFFNHTIHQETDTLLAYVNESLQMLDDNVLDSDLLTRIYNQSYSGHIKDIAAYIDDISGEKLDEIENLLRKKNISLPVSLGSLDINELMKLPQIANSSLPKGILESLADTSKLDLVLQVLRVNESFSGNVLEALPESTKYHVLMELLKKNVSLPQESLESFSNLPSLEVVLNLLRHNDSISNEAFLKLPEYGRQDVLLHLLKSNATIPGNAFSSLSESQRTNVLMNMLRNNVKLNPEAIASIGGPADLEILAQIIAHNDSLPNDLLSRVPETARLDIFLHILKNNMSLPDYPFRDLPFPSKQKLLKNALSHNISIPDEAIASLPEHTQKEVLLLLIKNSVSPSDSQAQMLYQLMPESSNMTIRELHNLSQHFSFQNENNITLVVLEIMQNNNSRFYEEILHFDITGGKQDDNSQVVIKRPSFTLLSDDMILDGDAAEDMVNITKEQKDQIMGKLRTMANEATVMAILASEEARLAMKKAVEAGKQMLDAVDENSRMLARLAKEKAQQAAEKAKAAARWSLNKARQGLLKVKEVGTALARGAWDVIHDLALNCRRYASAAFDGARLAVTEAKKSMKYVVQLADRALVYFRKAYAYVRNFCNQLGLRKVAVGVYCAEAKDYYCEKIEGSAIRLTIVFLMSIVMNITLVNYLISLSASVMSSAYTSKRKRRRKLLATPIKGTLSYQMAETGSYTMLSNI